MGNCLRNPRTALDPILMSDEGSHVAIGQNQPLTTLPELWTAETEITEGQLRGKRDTFWETAPAYDGRREIWDALKAACEAVEGGDHGLAQAILDGANISLPTGRLVEAYDELGNRYVVPKYCISKPANMAGIRSLPPPLQRQTSSTRDEDLQEINSATQLLEEHSPTTSKVRSRKNSTGSSTSKGSRKKGKRQGSDTSLEAPNSPGIPTGEPVVVKIRLSTLSKDIKMTLQASDRVKDIKKRLEVEREIPAARITMLYSGRVLNDRTYIKLLEIPKGFVIQAIVS